MQSADNVSEMAPERADEVIAAEGHYVNKIAPPPLAHAIALEAGRAGCPGPDLVLALGALA